jgi:hypothetical protein
VRSVKPAKSAAGTKHTDAQGLYLHVKASGKYWRMSYRYAGRQKTLALGVYPILSLAKARQKRDKARQLLAEGIDPNTAKREEKLAKASAAGNSFKVVALEWHAMKVKSSGAANTSEKRLKQMENHIFPAIGSRPIADIKPAEILAMMRAVAAKGTAYTAGRLRELCGQVFRYAIQTGRATYDSAASMRGAIEKPAVNHRPALTTRREFGEFDTSDSAAWSSAAGAYPPVCQRLTARGSEAFPPRRAFGNGRVRVCTLVQEHLWGSAAPLCAAKAHRARTGAAACNSTSLDPHRLGVRLLQREPLQHRLQEEHRRHSNRIPYFDYIVAPRERMMFMFMFMFMFMCECLMK